MPGFAVVNGNMTAGRINHNLDYIFNGTNIVTTDGTVISHLSLGFGVADSTRLVIVAMQGTRTTSVAGSITSMTIGGVSATKAIDEGAADAFINEIWYAAVPTGTTGDVVVTYNGAVSSSHCGCWSAYNAIATPNDTAAALTGSVTIDVPAEGFVVFNAYPNAAGKVLSGHLIERYDLNVESSAFPVIGGDYTNIIGEVNATLSVNDGSAYCVAASWGP